MKRLTSVTILIALFPLLASGACLPMMPSAAGNQGPVISSIEVHNPVIYPLGYSELECVASDPKGGTLRYTWSATGGKFSGEGAAVRWDAPADYGDYHVMVRVQDSSGNSTQGTVTVSVVVRPLEACCGGKGR